MRIDSRLVCFPFPYQLTAVIIHFCSWTVQMSTQVREIAINRRVPRCTHPLFRRTNHSSSFVDHFFRKSEDLSLRFLLALQHISGQFCPHLIITYHHIVKSFEATINIVTPKTLYAEISQLSRFLKNCMYKSKGFENNFKPGSSIRLLPWLSLFLQSTPSAV